VLKARSRGVPQRAAAWNTCRARAAQPLRYSPPCKSPAGVARACRRLLRVRSVCPSSSSGWRTTSARSPRHPLPCLMMPRAGAPWPARTAILLPRESSSSPMGVTQLPLTLISRLPLQRSAAVLHEEERPLLLANGHLISGVPIMDGNSAATDAMLLLASIRPQSETEHETVLFCSVTELCGRFVGGR
jgi:hypothetical protein